MSNEELAVEIQKGNKKFCKQLWEQVENFVKKEAYRYYNALRLSGRHYTPDPDDFISEGYIAVLEAVKYYDRNKDFRYITYLSKTLKKAFSSVSGLGTLRAKKEPLNNCNSLNIIIGKEGDYIELIDSISDDAAQSEFKKIELSETQQIISEAIAELSECDRLLIKMRFWREQPYETIGSVLGITAAAVSKREKRILRKLRINDNLRSLYSAFKMHYKGIEIVT